MQVNDTFIDQDKIVVLEPGREVGNPHRFLIADEAIYFILPGATNFPV